jgi:hypothetical protein
MAKIPTIKASDNHPVEKAMHDHSRSGSAGAASSEAARQSLKAEKELNGSLPLSLDVSAKKTIPTPETGD